MQSKENELAVEVSRCKGCIRKEENVEDSCQQWIRINNNINAVPDTLIKRSSNKIGIAINQIAEVRKADEREIVEQKLEGLRIIEKLEVEVIRRQNLRKNISQEMIEVLRRNIIRNKEHLEDGC